MNLSSEYDDILGMMSGVGVHQDTLSPIQTLVEGNDTSMAPEPFTPSKSSQDIDKAISNISQITPYMGQTFEDIEATFMNIGGEQTFLSKLDSIHDFFKVFIANIDPTSTNAYINALKGFEEHIDKTLTDEDKTKVSKELNENFKGFIDKYNIDCMTPIYNRVYQDNVTNRKIAKGHSKVHEEMKEIIQLERSRRMIDRDEAIHLIDKMRDIIFNLEQKMSDQQINNSKPKELILTRHEQQRAAHSKRFHKSMKELEKIAMGLNDTAAAIRHYSQMEIECSSKLHKDIELISLLSMTTNNGHEQPESREGLKTLEIIQERIKNLGKVYESLTNCIRGVLSSNYTITDNVSSEKVLSLLSAKEFDLPLGLDGQPSPIIAQVLISSIRSVLHSCPKQTWALHATLERIFVDTSKTSIHWSPISTGDSKFTWESLSGILR